MVHQPHTVMGCGAEFHSPVGRFECTTVDLHPREPSGLVDDGAPGTGDETVLAVVRITADVSVCVSPFFFPFQEHEPVPDTHLGEPHPL